MHMQQEISNKLHHLWTLIQGLEKEIYQLDKIAFKEKD